MSNPLNHFLLQIFYFDPLKGIKYNFAIEKEKGVK